MTDAEALAQSQKLFGKAGATSKYIHDGVTDYGVGTVGPGDLLHGGRQRRDLGRGVRTGCREIEADDYIVRLFRRPI